MSADRPLFGIVLMLGFCFMAPLGDSMIKLLGDIVPLDRLLLVRYGVQAAVLAPVVLLAGGSLRLPPRVLALTALRTVLHVLAVAMMALSLRHLPLAEAIAIVYVMPFLLLLLGWTLLGEEVGPRRLTACAVGFAGTMLVVKPSFAEVGWLALLPVLVAVAFAFFMLVTRQVAKAAGPVELQAVSGLMAVALLLPLDLSGLMGDWPLDRAGPPGIGGWGLLLAMGLLGTLGHLLMTWALRHAPAATLAPMQYLEIPFAALIGWLIFHDFPDGLAFLGICVTIGSGLYIIARERRPRPAKAPVPPA